MTLRDVPIRLPEDMVAALRALAAREDVTPGQIIRRAIARELEREAKAKTPNRADERLVASLQSLLAPDIAAARSWPDLNARLAVHGYRMDAAGGGVALFVRGGAKVCKGSELGVSYRTLVRRFGRALPGHPHGAVGLVGATGIPLVE
ncbi:ribbon-helix-helix protein, CopG family [Jannaschia sp.]|nr:ribbon-helix-helix protein, CopG family [Jannaschia sp.]